jgi:membrane-associated phospholipid phosphatase
MTLKVTHKAFMLIRYAIQRMAQCALPFARRTPYGPPKITNPWPPARVWRCPLRSNMTQVFKGWFLGLIGTTAFVTVSFQWLDRPMALWVYHLSGGHRIPTEVADRITSTPVVTAIVFVLYGIIAIMGRNFSKVEVAIAMCAMSSLAAIVIKDLLKFVFGRTWPDTWGPGITSFVRDNVYGFNFFQAGRAFESFPSGHAAAAAAVLSVVWILFPRLRIICAIGIFVADVGLIALNLHFLGDVVAGSFVGVSTGLFTVALWRASQVADSPSR